MAKTETRNTGAYGWNDEVDTTSTGERELLPEGEACFSVVKLERARKEYGKFGTINVAVLTLACSTMVEGSDAKAEIKVQLGLHHDLDWKITQFFTSIGQRKHGDEGKFVPNWAQVESSLGRCRIEHRKFAKKSDKPGEKTGITNEIVEFLAPEADKPEEDNLRF